MEAFFKWLLDVGLIEGGANAVHYYTKEADQAAIRHAISTAIVSLETAPDPTAKAAFYQRLQQAGGLTAEDPLSYYVDGQADQSEMIHLIDVSSRRLAAKVGTGTGGGTPPTPPPPTPPGVLQGGHTIRVTGGDGQPRFYQVYEFPAGTGNFVSYQFNDEAQARAILGDNFAHTAQTEAWFNQHVLARSAAEEIAGRKGTWQTLTATIMQEAAQMAGIRDPSLAGKMAADPEMQQILAQSIIGDWTPQQMQAEQRRTSFWKDVLYPGIENFYGRTDRPEQAWVEYQNSVAPALQELGYTRGADGTFNTQIKKMLDGQIDARTFLNHVPTFIHAVQNAEFADVLQQWSVQELGKIIEFGDWFDLMAGESAPELDAVVEKAHLAFEAQRTGLGLEAADINMLAAETQMSLAEMQRTFSEFAQGVLATGAEGLGRYGLEEIDVLRASAGLASGDKNPDEIRLQMAKIARENSLFDEDKINFYVGFNVTGQPQRPGLQSLAPERG